MKKTEKKNEYETPSVEYIDLTLIFTDAGSSHEVSDGSSDNTSTNIDLEEPEI